MSRLPRVLSFFTSIALSGFILIALGYVYLESQLPDVSELKNIQLQVPLDVYTSDGKLIGEFGPIRRAPVSFNQIPPLLVSALIATEDQRYYEHSGVDFRGLARAIVNLMLTGTKSEGASTITMQVARNFYLTRQKTFTRKFEEMLLALKIDRELSKDKILELYLNKIYFGQQAYGVAAAAQAYYGKTLDQLTLPEMAMLAGLPQAPSAINPITNPAAAKDRRDHVLLRLYDKKYITKTQYDSAVSTPLNASYHGRPAQIEAPYVGAMVTQMMQTTYGDQAFTQSYKVYTTINSQYQLDANNAVRMGLLAYDQRHGYRGPIANLKDVNNTPLPALEKYLKLIPGTNGLLPGVVLRVDSAKANVFLSNGQSIVLPWSAMSWTRKKSITAVVKVGDVIWLNPLPNNAYQLAQIPEAQAAFVSLNPTTGGITSLVGGFSYRLSTFNRIAQAQRQPGSSFKPFLYSAALNKGYTLASLFNDAPLVFNDPSADDGEWRPENAEKQFNGPTRLRVALARSLNLVSIRVLQAVGIEYATKFISQFGFSPSQLPQNLTMALGSADVTPLQMANSYATFANGGYRVNPYLIQQVQDANGKVLFNFTPTGPAPILSPEVDFLIVNAMKSVIQSGTGGAARSLGRLDLAGKTGTTNQGVDTWFDGFNGNVVGVAWLGYDQPKPTHEQGAQAALPIWIDFMRNALQGQPETIVQQPVDITMVKIDPNTGLLARPDQADAVDEFFTKETAPTQTAPDDTGPAGSGASSDTGEPIF
jgi:penicillin-binding protein 1A